MTQEESKVLSNRKRPSAKREPFTLTSEFTPKGDQPGAIDALNSRLNDGAQFQTLLGITGSGKTYTIANVLAKQNRPALVIAPNKTLAAQLYSEFREFFPFNRVRYFVSYYDYYQPEAYVPSTDTFIEKDSAINEEIDRMRHSATKALLEGSDVIIVASVSCIYGLGAPEDYLEMMLFVEKGDVIQREEILRKLATMQYKRTEDEFSRGRFRVRGETIDIFPSDDDSRAVRLIFFGNEIEEIREIDALSGATLRKIEQCAVYPVSHFVTDRSRIKKAIVTIEKELQERLVELAKAGKILEAQRLEGRTRYDLELLSEIGFCPGIENYSRHIAGRAPGTPPTTLIDYFPKDFILIIDESHVTVPQLGAMYRGDRSRKQTLVEYGFRLPCALDNRPLNFQEFWERAHQTIFVSATPAVFEIEKSGKFITEQLNRPTGLLDPAVIIRPAKDQVDDLISEIKITVERGERVLVTTLTKKMSERLSEYFREIGIKCRYLHSDINTIERVEILRGLRKGEFDVLIGINLLREGLDLVEVSLVAILDADKEGFLRSARSLIQTIGRAARNLNGRAILYGDVVTKSMEEAVSETNRRRKVQSLYNEQHGITPYSAKRSIEASLGTVVEDVEGVVDKLEELHLTYTTDPVEQKRLIEKLRREMYEAASQKEFERAAELRDMVHAIQALILSEV